jgi:adenylate kinase
MKEAMNSEAASKGAILDGVVRTVPQAEGLGMMLAELGKKVHSVLLFKVDDEELVARLSGRTVCEKCQTPYSGRQPGETCEKCGGKLVRRKDDEPDSIRNRLSVYREQTEPVIDWYKKNDGKIIEIEAAGSLDEVTSRAMQSLEK